LLAKLTELLFPDYYISKRFKYILNHVSSRSKVKDGQNERDCGIKENDNTKVNSAFHPSGAGKSSTGLSGWGLVGARLPVYVRNTLWFRMAGDAP